MNEFFYSFKSYHRSQGKYSLTTYLLHKEITSSETDGFKKGNILHVFWTDTFKRIQKKLSNNWSGNRQIHITEINGTEAPQSKKQVNAVRKRDM